MGKGKKKPGKKKRIYQKKKEDPKERRPAALLRGRGHAQPWKKRFQHCGLKNYDGTKREPQGGRGGVVKQAAILQEKNSHGSFKGGSKIFKLGL